MSLLQLHDGRGATATVDPVGAQVLALVDDRGRDVLWGGAAPWPHHAPVLFPQICSDRRTRLPHHGFARSMRFSLLRAGQDRVLLELRPAPALRDRYPHEFRLTVEHSLSGGVLTTRLRVANEGPGPLPYALGLHPGFPRSPGARLVFDEPEDGVLRRVVDDLLHPGREDLPDRRSWTLDDDLFAREALVATDVRSRRVTLHDGTGSAVGLSWSGFETLAVWSTSGAGFVCVEPWTGLPGTVDGLPARTRELPAGAVEEFSVVVDPAPSAPAVHEELATSGARP